MAARSAILKCLRVQPRSISQYTTNNSLSVSTAFNNILGRHFSDKARGSFLDKSEVTDRVLSVFKNFQKVDPSKPFQEGNGLSHPPQVCGTQMHMLSSLNKKVGAALPQCASSLTSFSQRSMSTVCADESDPAVPVAPRVKFKRLDKTARNIMQILDREAVAEVKAQREVPDINPGYIIQMKVVSPENKRRVTTIKGIVIARRNAGLNTTFRLRRLVAGIGVESLFPLYSPNIKEVTVLDKKKVRRAKLYYLRERMNPLKNK